jgi:APA family basic amino acid/polyamine antiporter
VLRLRRTAPALERPYRAWGYPVTPLVFIAFALFLVGNTARAQPADTAMSAGLVLAGLPLYWWWRRRAARAAGAGAAGAPRAAGDAPLPGSA